MSISRFSRVQPQKGFQRLSFQEMAVAPMQMRQREDSLLNARDAILSEMNNMTGIDDYSGETTAYKEQLSKKLDDLTNKIQKHGAGNMDYMDDFRDLRNDYNKAVSKTGILGMSSALKESLDAKRTAYYKKGYEENHDKRDIDRNWALKVQEYKQNLPSKLSEIKEGALPSFDPGMPPKVINKAEKALEYNKLMGAIEKTYPTVEYKRERQADGSVKIIAVDGMGKTVTNQPQIREFVNLMESEMLNPKSELRRYMDYTGTSLESMLSDFEQIGNIMLRDSRTQSGGTPRQNGNQNRGGATDTPKDKTELTVLQGNAEIPLENSYSLTSIDNEIMKMDRNEGKYQDMSEEDRNHARSSYLYTRRKIEKIQEDDTFQDEFSKKIAGNELLEAAGIKSWSDYKNVMANYQEPKSNVKAAGSVGTGGGGHMINPMTLVQQEVEKVQKEIVHSMDRNRLTNSEQYEFGMGTSDEKSKKLLVQTFTGQRMKSLLSQGGVELENEDRVFEKVDPQSDNYEKLMNLSDMVSSGDVSIGFSAINSGDAITNPEVMFSVTTPGKDGESFNIALDLSKDPQLAKTILSKDGPLYQELDEAGQAKFNAMRDNIKYRGVAVGASADMNQIDARRENSRFNRTENIHKYAKMRDEEVFGFYPQSTEDPNDRDSYALKNQFFRKEDGVDFHVEISETGGYRSFKRVDGKEIPFTFNDLFNKEFAAAYLKDNAQQPDVYPLERVTQPNPEGRRLKALHIVDFVKTLVSSVPNIDDHVTSMSVYNSSNQFKTAIKQIYHLGNKINNPNNLSADTLDQLESAWKVIANKPVEAKSVKSVL
jgi:hypothetical protein